MLCGYFEHLQDFTINNKLLQYIHIFKVSYCLLELCQIQEMFMKIFACIRMALKTP